MSDELSGHCSCGLVTWRTSGAVLWAGHCHCDSCRRATSAPFTSFFGVPRKAVIWYGELGVRESSNGNVRRFFCKSCGAQLSYQSTVWPDETHLYAATMDDPKLFRPQAHFHFAEKLPWIEVTDDLPKYSGTADSALPIAE